MSHSTRLRPRLYKKKIKRSSETRVKEKEEPRKRRQREREREGEEKVLNVTRETKNVSAHMAVDTHPVKGDDCEGFGHAEAAMETD